MAFIIDKEIKSLAEFYKHSNMKDGYINKCKPCNKKDVRVNRLDKVEYYRSYDRARGNRQSKEYGANWKATNPGKYQAQILTGNLIKVGRLLKKPCEKCGSDIRVHAHHDDYLRPFEVRWLCASHHSQWHKENGEGKNGKLDLKDYGITSIKQFIE